MRQLILILSALFMSTIMASAQDSTPNANTGATQQTSNHRGGQRHGHDRGHGHERNFSPAHQLQFLTDSLNLTEDQQQKIKVVLDDAAKKFKESDKKSQEDFKANIEAVNQSICAILTPDQQARFNELKAKRGKAEMNRNRNRHDKHDGHNGHRQKGPKQEKTEKK